MTTTVTYEVRVTVATPPPPVAAAEDMAGAELAAVVEATAGEVMAVDEATSTDEADTSATPVPEGIAVGSALTLMMESLAVSTEAVGALLETSVLVGAVVNAGFACRR